jgi:predicted HAD superfamily Cof-like phosphohydrolase
MQSNYDAVKQFTEESSNIKCPTVPRKMSKDEVFFLLKMVSSEMTELAQTVTDSYDEALDMVKNSLDVDPSNHPKPNTDVEVAAEQGDAMVDAWYYMLNAASKSGIDLSKIFDEVHDANMRKKDPVTGKFIRRNDGKILKPKGWTPSNIVKVVESMGKE